MKVVVVKIAEGIIEVGDFGEYAGCEVLDQKKFVYTLDSLADGKIIGAEIDSATEAAIDEKYGIHKK